MNTRIAGNGMPVVRDNDVFSFTLPNHQGILTSSDNSSLLKNVQLDFIQNGSNFHTVMTTLSTLFGMFGHGQENIETKNYFEWFFVGQDEDKIIFIEEGDQIVYDPDFYGRNKGAILIKMQNIVKWKSRNNDNIYFLISNDSFADLAQTIAIFYGHKARKSICKEPQIAYSFNKSQ